MIARIERTPSNRKSSRNQSLMTWNRTNKCRIHKWPLISWSFRVRIWSCRLSSTSCPVMVGIFRILNSLNRILIPNDKACRRKDWCSRKPPLPANIKKIDLWTLAISKTTNSWKTRSSANCTPVSKSDHLISNRNDLVAWGKKLKVLKTRSFVKRVKTMNSSLNIKKTNQRSSSRDKAR